MEMQEDSLWSLFPVQDVDTVLTNRLLYRDLSSRHFKETLKQTMLGQESAFEYQIHELHRLYQRQTDLMMEMEEINNFYTQPQHLFPDAGGHWMGSCISTSKTSVWSPEDKTDEAGISGDEIAKSGEKLLDLESLSSGCRGIWEEEGLKNEEVHEAPNFPKDQSPRSMSLESVVQPGSVQHLTGLSKFKCILDLNEPAKIEDHSDYELNQFLTPAQTSSERAETEMQEPVVSAKCQAENGIDLNMSPLSFEDEVTITRTIESEQPQGCVSASLHRKHGSAPSHSRVIVLALPSSKAIPIFHKRYSRPRKKAIRGANSTNAENFPPNKTRKRSNLVSNFGVNEDDYHSLSTASYIPDSDHHQECLEKRSSSSVPEVKRRRRCKPQVESGKVMRKISRTKSKTRGSFLVTEEEEEELSVAAAEAIVDMSQSDLAKMSSIKTSSDCINSLHWFAKIASSVVEDSKSKVGLSVTGIHSDYRRDYIEAMTFQLTEMKPEQQRTSTTVSNVVHPKHKRNLRSQGKRQLHDDNLPSLSTFTGNEASRRLQKKRGKLMEGSEKNDANSSLMENMIINWGTITKGRRGIRSPATNTKTLIPFLLSGS